MSAVSLTIKALLDQATIRNVTANRIYPFPLPLNAALPAIAVALSSESEDYLLAGSAQYPLASVQVHCVTATSGSANELGEAVKTALRDLLFTSGDVNASFQKSGVDFTDFADDLSTHRRVMSFDVRWR
ncbi:DUF3168 domain-containing protein [Mesorhizobium sp. M1A.F.Ca.ET.072.01.1.1]|uniref:tail completion protein gp17 n=1 Tax=Mesorhizobium sp. M1A.F.Ca.ET.072.01.1.1 TaxID=2496753 RepID=UPI000FD2F251|nr:DUF3168 domain-containing protein [Mesorhizobium sp. M1A.F.Ca.ET.072.01.1.1]RUW47289.1 DUF3168 domain-containing protein [Mesorhizobium sp. M1A.F.Ca.ET.072.01.1.1]TIV04338.1 MAG: DUF3168 domain-containing protein [Mesorhizobium sp.]